jgi:hypothetical protein
MFNNRGFGWGAAIRFFLLAAGLLALWFLAQPAEAQFITSVQTGLQCGSYTRMRGVLTKKYSEAPKAYGRVNPRRMMEIYVSERGSWTVLVTSADGNSCIVAAGTDFEDIPWKPETKS